MKTLRLLSVACALSLAWQGQAQTDSSKALSHTKKWNHEIGINAYSSTIRGGNFYSDYKSVYDHYAVSGLYLKFFHGKSAIRSSVDYFQKIIINRSSVTHDKDISFKTLQFAAGYQRHFGNKKVMPYVFTDLAYGYGSELIRGYHYGPLYLPYDFYGYNPMTIKTHAYSATPGIGLRLRLRKNMILNLETAAEFFYMKQFGDYRLDAHEITGINIKPLKCSFGFTF